MRKCIFAVQGTLQFVAGFIAMDWYEKFKAHGDESECVLVLYDFLCSPEVEQSLVDSITRLSTVRKWHKIVFISGEEMRRISCQRYSNSIKDFKKIIGFDAVDEIYICRDTYGFGSALMLNAYPKAVRIMYGDSFGMAGQEVKYRWTWGKESVYITKHFLRELWWGKPTKFKFDAAVLSIPIDLSGSYLDRIPLIIPPKKHVIDGIERFSRHLVDLNSYCDALLEGQKNNHLFLLDTLSASGMMSREQECELYAAMVRRMSSKGATILVKNHFRNPPHVMKDLVNALKDEYTIKIIDNAPLSSMPIELWVPLINNCKIVPVLSFSALSLKYIYNKEVPVILNEDDIQKYIFPEHAANITKQRQTLLGCLRALENWDEKSVLWRCTEGRAS